MNKLNYDYDMENDSLFIYSIDPYNYEVSLELDNDVILDIDTEEKPVAFEFLNASKIFKINKEYFQNIVSINIQSSITTESISLKVKLTYAENQISSVNRIISNLNNIPNRETELVTV